jgi:hypothetical protein
VLVLLSAVLALRASTSKSSSPLIAKPQAAVATEDSYIGSLVTWGGYMAWMGYSDPSGKGARIFVHDLKSKKTEVLAKDLFAGGLSWVRGGGNFVVYLSLAHLPCDDLPQDKRDTTCLTKPRPWQVLSADLKSGKQNQIAASKTAADEVYPPLPEVSFPYAVWANPPTEASSSSPRGIAVYDFKSKKKQTVLPGTIVARATVGNGTLVYAAAVPGAGKWDLFSASPEGKKIRRLTNSGRVIFPRTSDSLVTWQEKQAASGGQPQADLSAWVTRISGKSRPLRIAAKGSNPAPGDGFVVWVALPSEGEQLLLRDDQAKTQPVVLEQQPNFAAGWWADGSRLVWATTSQDGPKLTSVIHVAEVKGR